MGLVGSIAGGALGAVGSIFGGITASSAMKKVGKSLKAQQQANQQWYDRRYNEDATQRADAQAILNRTEDSIRKRNRQAAGSQAVIGGTDASVAAAKAANNEALTQATTNIAINADARKDQIEQQYQQKNAQINDALNNLETNKAQAIGSAVQGVLGAAGNMAEAF